MSPVALAVLGSFALTISNDIVSRFRTNRVQAMLAFLAVETGLHRRDRLTELLWPGMPSKSARQNLRQTLYELRKLMTTPDETPFLLGTRNTVQRNPAFPLQLDTARFHALLQQQPDEWCDAVTLYRGAFLEDFHLPDAAPFEAWAADRRAMYRQQVLDTLTTLADIYVERGDWQSAETMARRQLGIDPLRERAHRQLMTALALRGDRAGALRQYERCRMALSDQVNLAPATETLDLAERIRAGERAAIGRMPITRAGYQITERIGGSQFATLFRATQSGMGRDVAIKVIRNRYANDPAFIRRFEADAQRIATLEHPHIVPLYDYWREPGSAYLVTRWLSGGSVAQQMQHPWPVDRVLALLRQSADALSAAHSRGIVHGAIKPANILLDELGNVYLSDFGVARDGGHQSLSNDVEIPAHTAPSELEGERPLTPDDDIYNLAMVAYALLAGDNSADAPLISAHARMVGERPLASLLESRPDVPPALHDALQTATAQDPLQRFPTATGLAHAIAGAVANGINGISAPAQLFLEQIDNPYVGLQPFGEADAGLFFGRNALIRQLTDKIARERFLALVGPSGSGKSSVVRAGLIPALRQSAITDSDTWFITDMLPGVRPYEELANALMRVAVEEPYSLLHQLQDGDDGLVRVVKRVLPAGSGQQLLLIVDQFEELFMASISREMRRRFLRTLETAVSDPDAPVRVLITLRADFYDRPLLVAGFSELVRAHTVVITPLNSAELSAAIQRPAAAVGVSVETSLTTALVADVLQQPGALPLLQFTLTELFERRSSNLLTLAAYQRFGGINGALSRRADAIYLSLQGNEQAKVRQLFLRLVTLGEGVEDTRRRVALTELSNLGLGDIVARDQGIRQTGILDAFCAARLLTLDRDPGSREPTVEVAHEALLREWPRLRGWLNESRDDIRQQRSLHAAVLAWSQANRDPAYLLRGSRLEHFQTWASAAALPLNDNEQQFLNASVAAHERAIQAQTAQRRREARLQRRTRRVLLTLVGVFALAAVVSFVLTGYAFDQRDEAQRVRLAAQAQTALDRGEDMVLPALLAIQSLRYAYSAEADVALLGALAQGFTRQFVGHADSLASVAFSPDGRYVLTAANDGTARLWDVETGSELRQFVGHSDLVTQALFSPDGSRVVTGGADGTVRVWDSATGAELSQLPSHDSPIWALAFAPDAQTIAIADESGHAWLWNIDTITPLRELPGHDGVILALDFSPDGQHLATGGVDATVRVWDVASGTEELQISDHVAAVNSVVFSPSGDHLLTGSSDNLAYLLNSADGTVNQMYLGHSNVIQDANFSPDGEWIVTSSYDGTVRLWDSATGQEVERFVRQAGRVVASVFSADGSAILSASTDPVARMWSLETASEPRTFAMPFYTTHGSDPIWVGLSSDQRQIIVGASNGLITHRDMATGRITAEYQLESPALLTALEFSSNGALALTATAQGTAQLWDVASLHLVRELRGHGGPVWDVAFSPDDQFALTASEDGTARLWQVDTGDELRRFIGHTGPLRSATISPDGSTVLTGSEDGSAWLWETATGLERHRLIGHSGPVRAVAFSPDGTVIVTGSEDATARVWQAEDGAPLTRLVGHAEAIRAVGFMPDGATVATGSNDGTARLWDAETGHVVRQLSDHKGPIRLINYSADGRHLFTAENAAVRMWQTLIDDVIVTACAQLPRDLSPQERSAFDIAPDSVTCPVE